MQNETMHGRGRCAGATVIEVVLVGFLLLVAALGGLLLIKSSERPGHRTQINQSHLATIHQAMQSHGQDHRRWLPGLDSKGRPVAPTAAERFQVLLEGDRNLSSEDLLNPAESKTPWDPKSGANATEPSLTLDHFSYALQDISQPGVRQKQWNSESGAQVLIGGDRNTGADTGQNIQSLWDSKPGSWSGHVLWADGHITMETSPMLTTEQSGPDVLDHLFETGGTDDAFWVFDQPTVALETPGSP